MAAVDKTRPRCGISAGFGPNQGRCGKPPAPLRVRCAPSAHAPTGRSGRLRSAYRCLEAGVFVWRIRRLGYAKRGGEESPDGGPATTQIHRQKKRHYWRVCHWAARS